MASASNQDMITRPELEAMNYDDLQKMDEYLYKVNTHHRSAYTFTRKTRAALIRRILKKKATHSQFKSQLNSYAKYELEHPIAKLIPYQFVNEIYSIKETMEDRDYEIAFLKSIFERETLPPYVGFIDIAIGQYVFNLRIEGTIARHYRKLYNPNLFIKDYSYLVKKFGLTAKTLKEGDAQSKREWINRFIEEDIVPAILYYGVIDTMLESIEEYINYIKRASRRSTPGSRTTARRLTARTANKNNFLTLSHAYANRVHHIDYLPRELRGQNKPIKILKIYIKALNISLNKLRGHKIILNTEVVKDLNERLTRINDYLINPNPSTIKKANLKFKERLVNITMKYANRGNSYTLKKSRSRRSSRRIKSV